MAHHITYSNIPTKQGKNIGPYIFQTFGATEVENVG